MWWFYRKGPSGFSGASTAEEVTAGVDGSGLVAVITGASNGIGLETARVLALRGVHVVMPVRNVAAGFAVRESIVAKIPGARIGVLEMDLSSMASVRRFASEFESLNLPLNILMDSGTEGRIVNVTSSGHIMTYPEGICFDKIHDPSGSVEQGAATTCYVAMHPQVQGTSGKYFADCNVASPSLQASDPELAKKLWQFSLKTVSP
nr:unnamed protein product [Digitaria exilis]